jgi:hypothetical protein
LTVGAIAAIAASSSNNNDVAPGVLGFLVFAAMAVALVFLFRSMNKQFHKITPTKSTASEGSGGSEVPGDDQEAKPPAQRPS